VNQGGSSGEMNIMLKSANNKWIWMSVYCAAVLIFLILEISHIANTFKSIIILPMVFLFYIFPLDWLSSRMGNWYEIGIMKVCIPVLVFAIELAIIFLPIYFYKKTKRKRYLFMVCCVVIWIIASYCWGIFWYFFLN
jgi:hypothetical protein